MTVKTSDDSLCPRQGLLFDKPSSGDSPSVGENENSFPSPPPPPPPRHFQMLARWNEPIPLKYDTKETWSTLSPRQKKPSSLLPTHFLYPSFYLLPHQNHSTSHHLLGFFYPQVLNVVPKNISPFLLGAFHLTLFFPVQAAIIGMWLIIAEGGRQAGMTVNQPSQGFVVPAVMSPSAPVSGHMSTFLPGASGWLIGAEPLAMSERI